MAYDLTEHELTLIALALGLAADRTQNRELGFSMLMLANKLGRDQRRPSITCPVCHMTSFHPCDIEHRYCGNCHRYHEDMKATRET